MVQIKLSVIFLIAAAAIAPVVALPLKSSESVQPATVDSDQNPIPDTPLAAAAIPPAFALPLKSSESVQPATVDSNQNPIPDTPQAASDHIAADGTVAHGGPRVLRSRSKGGKSKGGKGKGKGRKG